MVSLIATCDELQDLRALQLPGLGAERLTEALEAAADLTKPQLRQLAAQVRAATAEAWPERGKEAGAG